MLQQKTKLILYSVSNPGGKDVYQVSAMMLDTSFYYVKY